MEDNGNEKRLMLAIVLSVAVMLLYPWFLSKLYPPAVTPAPSATAPPTEIPVVAGPGEASVSTTTTSATTSSAVEGAGTELAAAPAAAVETPPVTEELVTVETPLYRAVFTSLGAGVKEWELKTYKVELGGELGIDISATAPGLPPVKTNSLDTTVLGSLVPPSGRLNFSPSKDRVNVSAGDTAELVFSWTSPEGLVVEKKYTFDGDGYTVGMDIKVFNGTGVRSAVKTTTTLVISIEDKDPYFKKGPIKEIGDKVTRRDEDDGTETGTARPQWIGVADKYFLKVFIPGEGPFGEWESRMETETEASASVSRLMELAPGEREVTSYNVYMGPKEFKRLKKLGIEEAIEFGFMSWLAKPFLGVLNFFERYLANYGLAIIILTVIIKIIFYPLTKKSLHSMKQMQRVQPQMAALREKYKDDKQKMNTELMELYKRHNVNPLGGCLPMLLQIPVFIALYEVLYAAIELRHSPFMLWIVDLSAKDPYYITPVLMGASMFLQQKMTPTAMDPMQAKIMLMLPIMFTFIFLQFPAGLVLYWLVNNLISIAQQWHIYKKMN